MPAALEAHATGLQHAKLLTPMLPADTLFNRYRILRPLGAGGVAEVYEALDERLGRSVALKIFAAPLSRNSLLVERVETELRAVAALEHPGIVRLYEVGQDQGRHFFAMRLLAGGDLRRRIAGGMIEAEALEVLRETADALSYAHAHGFTHRNVKPENILFDEQGAPVLTDLGIAKAMEGGSRITATGFSIGAPRYTSPEQARGQPVDARTDLYALGVVLYEMLTGQPPYDGDESLAIVFKHVTEPIPRLPEAQARLQPLLDTLMAKEPAQRPASAQDLIAMIDRLEPARRGRFASASAGSEAQPLEIPPQIFPEPGFTAIAPEAPALAAELAAQLRRHQATTAPEAESGVRNEAPKGTARRQELDLIKAELQALQTLEAERQRSEAASRREQEEVARKLRQEAEARNTARLEQLRQAADLKVIQGQERRRQTERLQEEAALMTARGRSRIAEDTAPPAFTRVPTTAAANARPTTAAAGKAVPGAALAARTPKPASLNAPLPRPRTYPASKRPDTPVAAVILMLLLLLVLGGVLWWQLQPAVKADALVAPAVEMITPDVPAAAARAPNTAVSEPMVLEPPPAAVTGTANEAGVIESATTTMPVESPAMPAVIDTPVAASAPTVEAAALTAPLADVSAPAAVGDRSITVDAAAAGPAPAVPAGSGPVSGDKSRSAARKAISRRDPQCDAILDSFAREGDLSPAQREFLKKNC